MGKSIFTSEQIETIKNMLKVKNNREVLKFINSEYKINMTESAFKSWRSNHKIKGLRFSYNKGKCWIPAEHIEYIKAHVHEYEAPTLAIKLNELYGTSYTSKQIKAFKINHHVTGYEGTGGYNKNRPNPHKNQKGWHVKNSEKTQFKKGHKIWNEYEIGEESKTTDGYLIIKTGSNKWEFKHRLLWEKYYGKIPEGKIVAFLDNNKENCNINNLILITQEENGVSRSYRRLGNSELSKAVIYTHRINNKVQETKEE